MAKKTKQATTKAKSKQASQPSNPGTSEAGPALTLPAGLPQLSRFQGFEAVTIDRRQIKNASYNPRVLSPAQRNKLKRSIEKFKLVETLVWNVRTGNLVGGHQRIGQIDNLEGTDQYSLTVARIDVDDATERALNIALNNPELQGNYDLQLLGDVVTGLLDSSPALVQDAGLDRSSLAMLFGDSFLLPAAAQQATQDAPIVDALNEMYGAGQANEKARRAAQAQLASAGGQAVPAPGRPATNPAPDHNPPDGAQPPAPATPAPFDFAARRREFNADRRTLDEADVYLTLVFDHATQLAAFRHHLGLDPMSRTVDAVQFAGLVELEMGELEAAFAEHEAEDQDGHEAHGPTDEPQSDAIPPDEH